MLSLESYFRRGISMVITTDASPYGIGGTLEIGGEVVSFFAGEITSTDKAVLSLQQSPSCKDQQTLEALAMLVALRLWSSYWSSRRVVLTVRSDNVSTLAMVAKMQPHGPQLGLIARELALDVASASYVPDVAVHLPGLANKAADALSRKHDPNKAFVLPAYLANCSQIEVPPRLRNWWQSLPAEP